MISGAAMSAMPSAMGIILASSVGGLKFGHVDGAAAKLYGHLPALWVQHVTDALGVRLLVLVEPLVTQKRLVVACLASRASSGVASWAIGSATSETGQFMFLSTCS